MPTTVIFQVKCMSMNSKNRKGDPDLERSIIETQSVFLWTGNKEEDIIGV